MPRLIDADALIEATDGISQDPTCPMHIAAEYYQYMTEAPTIEAEPVRHGRWIISSDGYYPYCSECKEEPKGGNMTKHCPNCGAKMDGDSHDQA